MSNDSNERLRNQIENARLRVQYEQARKELDKALHPPQDGPSLGAWIVIILFIILAVAAFK